MPSLTWWTRIHIDKDIQRNLYSVQLKENVFCHWEEIKRKKELMLIIISSKNLYLQHFSPSAASEWMNECTCLIDLRFYLIVMVAVGCMNTHSYETRVQSGNYFFLFFLSRFFDSSVSCYTLNIYRRQPLESIRWMLFAVVEKERKVMFFNTFKSI